MSELEPTRTCSNPTATERLRAMLDERGVEWWQKKRHTCWKVGKGQEVEMWRAWEAPDGSLTLKVDYIYHLTPEQAIAATLGDADATSTRQGGAGTCHDEGDPGDFCCSACGVRMFTDTSDTYTMIASDGRTIIKHPNYCPNCGRRCVW